VGGGRANADAVVGARDVLAAPPRAGGAARLRELLRAWRTGR
jgi:hypothetical protein